MTNFTKLATEEVITRTVKALVSKHIDAMVVTNGTQALEKIKTLIPRGATVMNGTSMTLIQIGFMEYLKSGHHGWVNTHEKITAENDPAKRAELRKQAITADYYLGSVHALMETGEFIVASNTGSQLPPIVFTSNNLILVVSTKKIVPDFNMAMKRLEEYVVPLEDKRMMAEYGMGTSLNKIVIFKNENPALKRNVSMILVQEDLGF